MNTFLMKIFVKIICAIAVSFAHLSCVFFDDKMPVMDSRVVSYKLIDGRYDYYGYFPKGRDARFMTDKDTLKVWFPHIFDKEQTECNYFAIYFGTPTVSNTYWILSQDLVLYKIKPNTSHCEQTDDLVYQAMLVCDENKEGNLKDKIDLKSIRSYTDEDWDCRKGGKNVFF